VCIHANKRKRWTRIVRRFLPKEFGEAVPSDGERDDGDGSKRNGDREAESGGGSIAEGISTV